MGNTISRIKSGLPDLPMARHNNNRDIETTFDIGTVQTLQMKVMNGNSVFNCDRWASVVRIGAMPVPTFGRLKYKMYNRFVKMEDLYPAWSAFLEQKPYTGSTLTYVPQQLPYSLFSWISRWILSNPGSDAKSDDPASQPFTYYKVYLSASLDAYGLHEANAVPYYGSNGINTWRTANDLDFFEWLRMTYEIDLDADRNVYQNEVLVDDAEFYRNHLDDITLENADYVIKLDASVFFPVTPAVPKYIYICFRLTRRGKVLVKHLNALGWKFDAWSSRPFGIPYLVGLYKCYFDMMMPSKDSTSPRTWDMTAAYKLLHYCLDHNHPGCPLYFYTDDPDEYPIPEYISLFREFMDDLSLTYYYDDSDYLAAHIISPSISPEQTPGLSSSLRLAVNTSKSVTASSGSNQQPLLGDRFPSGNSDPDVWSALNIRLALRLLAYTGKDTVLGGKIRESLKAHYGYDVEEHGGLSYNVANFVMDVIISDIYSTADTRDENDKGALLGSLGGKAGAFTGDAANPKPFEFMFEAPSYGMLYSFGVVVPESGFCQGVDNNISRGCTSKWEIYNQMLDALGYDLSRKDIFLGENLVSFGRNDGSHFSEPYGFIPRMTDTKITVQNIINGDLARRSTRQQLLAYTLNKFISPKDLFVERLNESDPDVNKHPDAYTTYYIREVNGAEIPVASPEVSSFGRPWMMNFGRIFYLDDEFKKLSYGPYGSALSNKYLFGLYDHSHHQTQRTH